MDAPNNLQDITNRQAAKGTVQDFKMKSKSQSSMIKPINSGSKLASPLQKASNYKFGKGKR